MEPLLSKQEIASLLTAIEEGDVSLSEEAAKFQETKKRDAAPVDLFTPVSIRSREQTQIANVDIIVDIFCKSYATTLANKLQRTFSIQRHSMEIMQYQKFMTTTGNSGTIGVLSFSLLPTGALAVFDQELSFAILEIMLGAAIDIESPVPERKVTTLEMNILRSSFIELCPDLNKAFSPLGEIKTTLEKLENNARLVSITEPDAEVIVASLQVAIRKEIGKIYLLFPVAAFTPLREQLQKLLQISSPNSSTWQQIFSQRLRQVPLSVTARSGEFTITIRDLLQIHKGDVLEIDYDPNQPLQILVEGRHKFNAIAGTHNGNKAISLTDLAE